ncbi:MAG: TetR/AcrR family transcriptional regulator [Haliea sp.]|nr:TetR/AcrR family transcriptional regulator [Haliea sp.]
MYSVNAGSQAIADLHGRPLGARALEKRGLILAATRALLEERGLREIRVADIARAVDTSPATFYQYFSAVEHVVLHLAAELNSEIPALLELFDGMWRGKEGQRRAFEVVNFFFDYWDRHGPILRIRNLAAEEGDVRFMALRRDAMEPVLAAMEALMRRNTVGSKDPLIDPPSAALAMSAILDRLAAVHQVVEGERVSRDALMGTSAQILFRTLTGK